MCSLSYPACEAYMPYYHVCPVWLHHIFPLYLTHPTIFETRFVNTKCVFWFSLRLLSETFLILRIIKRDITMLSTRYSSQILIGLEFPRQIFEKKSSNIKFHQNLSNGSRIVPCGQTDMKLQSLLAILRTRLKCFGNYVEVNNDGLIWGSNPVFFWRYWSNQRTPSISREYLAQGLNSRPP